MLVALAALSANDQHDTNQAIKALESRIAALEARKQ